MVRERGLGGRVVELPNVEDDDLAALLADHPASAPDAGLAWDLQ